MRCHYEVLGVARDIAAADLRKAFFKLALKWHPDKIKPDQNVEEATTIFQEIQSAYEVLSDPQERQWYDDHREQILRGDDGDDHATEEDPLDLMRYFSPTVYKGFKDDDAGFFSVYRTLFEQIDALDQEARGDKLAAPSFGSSKSNVATDVNSFYNYWRAYATDRSFSWLDIYKTTDAPTREIRRLMEKDNKKARDGGKKAFSANVRALVEFVRKRDKRMAKYLKELEAAKEAAAKEKEALAKEKRAAFEAEKASFQAQWEADDDVVHAHVEAQVRAEVAKRVAKQEAMILVCDLCKKEFKSEKQVENHLKSKKHREQMIASGLDPSMLDELLELESSERAVPDAAQCDDVDGEKKASAKKETKAAKVSEEDEAKRREREEKDKKAAEKRAERKEKRKTTKKDDGKKEVAKTNDFDDDEFPCGSCAMAFPTLKMLQKHTKKEGHEEPKRRK
ncbi:hypothetical protein SDRG_13296 [Saprolegnia diclina VS20]|uniref:DnaJ like subfamily A member 5 n=1 Tax=Saprolegnia diclina (strain VS20) TaxID=1156394 RepID=T0PU01_SAPDV|nr:hypothetical protein SDRG_13296 [Saprolegnia diclina VS20]EQC28959.1 hypothetical protein SDRG_13296 [Saprolegnia diclina VS20]|eukprot:XP_008617598.1 hypothetical protein SDRG_13296 [Saprolegnia diclina VS20]